MKCAYCDTDTKETLRVSEAQYSMVKGEKVFRAAAVIVPVCATHKAQLEPNLTHKSNGQLGKPAQKRLEMEGQFTIEDYLR